MAFHELRQYLVKQGKMAEWLTLMEGEIIPYVQSKGMVLIASFRGEVDDSVYVWIRRFENETHREQLYAAVYESDHWKNSLSPRIGTLIERDASIVQRIVPTAHSPVQ
ncbi:MAG: NIPSNAP family protein [Sulfitobacter sp.]